MFWLIVLIVLAGVLAYRFRVPLLARLLGQDKSRIERRLNQRKR
jgi:hypothetical protein